MKRYVLPLAWFSSLLGLLGSYYFSEVRKLPPCAFCWYQRGLMLSLLLIISIALWRKDKGVYPYAIAFSLLGLFFCSWQILQNGFGFPGLCETGCLPKETIAYYIPWGSFLLFAAIFCLQLILRKQVIDEGLPK